MCIACMYVCMYRSVRVSAHGHLEFMAKNGGGHLHGICFICITNIYTQTIGSSEMGGGGRGGGCLHRDGH